jgi:hypothetical protein
MTHFSEPFRHCRSPVTKFWHLIDLFINNFFEIVVMQIFIIFKQKLEIFLNLHLDLPIFQV